MWCADATRSDGGVPRYGKQWALKAEGPNTEAADEAVRAFRATVLGFVHPVKGAELRFESALPGDIAALLGTLRTL